MSNVDFKKIFDGFDPKEHDDGVKQRWGDTDAYTVSTQRTKGYTEADWQRFAKEQGAIYADAVAARNDGVHPDEPCAMDIAERHRLSFDRWFYPCSPKMHSGLADCGKRIDVSRRASTSTAASEASRSISRRLCAPMPHAHAPGRARRLFRARLSCPSFVAGLESHP